MSQIVRIGEIVVRADEHGRFSLNDLHRAAGGERKHGPSLWMENQQTQELVAALAQEMSDTGNPVSVVRGGPAQGTFVCTELVYAYAAWISAAFHLRVIRVFHAVATGDVIAAPVTSTFAVPQTMAQALRLAADQAEEIDRQQKQLEEQRPQVEFAQAVRNTSDAISVGDMARLMGIGQNRFFRQLRADHILMAENRPYQHYIDRGYFRVVESVWIDAGKEPHPSFKTLVTGRGQVYLQRKYGQQTEQAA